MLNPKRLSLSHRLALGLASMAAILAVVVFVTIYRAEANLRQTHAITERQLPLADATNEIARAVAASTSALRGWVLLGDDSFRHERQTVFQEQIEPAVATLTSLLDDADERLQQQLQHVNAEIDVMRRLQDEIELVAMQPENIPARQLFAEDAEPQAEIMGEALTKMIDLEKFQKPSDLRRQILLALAETQGSVERTTSNIRAFLLTGDSRFKEVIDAHWTRAVTRQQELFMTDFAFSEEQKLEWSSFSKAFQSFKPYPAKIVALRDRDDWNLAQHRMRYELDTHKAELSAKLESLRAQQREILANEVTLLLDGNKQLVWVAWTSLGIGLLLALLVGISMNRSVLGSVRQLADTMQKVQEDGALYRRANAETNDEIGLAASAFNNLLASWQQMVLSVNGFVEQLVTLSRETRTANVSTLENMHDQRSQTRSIADALQNLRVSVEQVANSAAANAEVATKADAEAQTSMQIVNESRDAVTALSKELGEASQEVTRLTEDSAKIGDVLSVVQGIADQTNLLALNAAIEAARAGDVGRGFAVVADEVRTLAQRTQESVNSVGETVNSIQTRVGAVVNALERGRQRMQETDERSALVAEALDNIVNSFSATKSMNDQMLAATLEKQRVSSSISDSAGEINQFADKTVVIAERAVNASEQLSELSADLHRLFEGFEVEQSSFENCESSAAAAVAS